MLSGLQSAVLFVDGLKTGTTIKLSFATGNIAIQFVISSFFVNIHYVYDELHFNLYKMHYIFYRCQIAVHQECYGAKNVRDFTSWVCKACETPDIKRECCLCPVKGLSCTMFQTYAIYKVIVFLFVWIDINSPLLCEFYSLKLSCIKFLLIFYIRICSFDF